MRVSSTVPSFSWTAAPPRSEARHGPRTASTRSVWNPTNVIEHRPLHALGATKTDWLDAKLHFAFAGLGRPEHRPLGALRVWNDDAFAAFSGFPSHLHQNVEIVTYVRDGAITHADSVGNQGRTAAGEVQVMSAGTGIFHSEFNAETVTTRLFQIWLEPRVQGGEPRWSNRRFPDGERAGRLVALASGDPEDIEALFINAEARVLGATLQAGEVIVHRFREGRRAYVVSTTGRIDLQGHRLGPRDGAAISDEAVITITALDDTNIVLVELL
jgi:redox-sensitive bicupin YhaK (pirin superfamily)